MRSTARSAKWLPDVGAEVGILAVGALVAVGRRIGEELGFGHLLNPAGGLNGVFEVSWGDGDLEEGGIRDAKEESGGNGEVEDAMDEEGVSGKLHLVIVRWRAGGEFEIDDGGGIRSLEEHVNTAGKTEIGVGQPDTEAAAGMFEAVFL